MGGLGALDKVAFDLSKKLINQFGGTGTIEIKARTSGGGFTASTFDTTTISDIPITPPAPYQQDTDSDTPIASGLVETYVAKSDITTEPIANQSFLTIKQTDFIDASITNRRLKIMEVNPVMGGNSIAMYQLICEGSH